MEQAKRRKAVSFRDVAKLAGVSTATVSRTLSHPDMVSESTRQRVEAAISQSNMVVNAAARAFKVQHSNILLMVAGDPGNPFNGAVIRGALRRARELGYALILSDDSRPASDQVREFLLSRRGDGVALLWRHLLDERTYRSLVDEFGKPPIVGVRQGSHVPPYPHVVLDNEAAAYRLARHVLAQGHRRISIVAAGGNGDVIRARIAGIKAAMREKSMTLFPERVMYVDLSSQGGRVAAQSLAASSALPTAVMCTNDLIAAGLVSELMNLGYAVPKDVSVTGFDNLELVDCLQPALTTVHQPREEIGSRCIDLLVQSISSDTAATSMHLDLPLVLRASVAAEAVSR